MPGRYAIAITTVGLAVSAAPQLFAPTWAGMLVAAMLAGRLVNQVKRRRFWNAHQELAALTGEFKKQVQDMAEAPVCYRSDDAGVVFRHHVRRRRFPLSLVRQTVHYLDRIGQEHVEEVVHALDDGQAVTVVMDLFYFGAAPGMPVMSIQQGAHVCVDDDGEMTELHRPAKRSWWANIRAARKLVDSGYVFTREPDLRAAVESLRGARPLDTSDQDR
jgi:hypothetical protein